MKKTERNELLTELSLILKIPIKYLTKNQLKRWMKYNGYSNKEINETTI